MNRLWVRSTVLATTLAAVTLASAGVPVAAAVTTPPRAWLIGPVYDAPGSVLRTTASASRVPAGYAVRFTVTGGTSSSCTGRSWRHDGHSVSQYCYVAMPKTRGTWTLRVTARLTKRGAPNLRATNTLRVRTQGYAVKAVGPRTRALQERCYNTSGKVWLTFDDGFISRTNLTRLLATLKRQNVRGRFFLIGSWAKANPSLVSMIRRDGHLLENHTYSHPSLESQSAAAVRSQIRGAQVTGTRKLLRPPYGAGLFSYRLHAVARSLGYRLCGWAVDPRDWSGVGARTIQSRVMNGDYMTSPVRPGDVVLMHLSGRYTVSALPGMISRMKAKLLSLDRLR